MANNFPNLLPSLNLDLVNGIYVDPRITFTRAGTRTYYGRDVVKAEENLLLQSQTFNTASWTKGASVTLTTDAAVAPDGTSTAEMFSTALGSDSSAQQISQVTTSGTGVFTVSIFLRSASSQTVRLKLFENNGVTLIANEDVSVTSTWTRFAFTVTVTTANFTLGIRPSGTALTDIEIWGAQLEQRSSATAYTATTTQTITNYQRQLKTAAANEWPREFDPVTGECLGRSVWESRTNLSLRSEEFDNAYWTKVGATVSANQVIAPDGTLSMDKLVEDTANSGHSVQGTGVSVTSGIVYTFTIYAKAAERSFIRINGNTTGLVGAAYYNLSTGALGTVAAGTTASIVNVGNGIYRCVFTRTATATSSVSFLVSVTNADNVSSYLGDGYSGIYIWGAQLEAGAFATPYIPTVAAQVTRLADSAVMTGTNFSSWFNPSEGTFVVNSTGLDTSFTVAVQVDDGTTSNRIGMIIPRASSASPAFIFTSGAAQTAFSNVTFVGDDKEALSYAANNVLLSVNGAAVQTDTTVVLPVVDRLRIRNNSAAPSSGYIKRITYYPQALTAANLQAVTR
jgi:hypothetical protein